MSDSPRSIDSYDLHSREMTILLGLCENLARAMLAQRRIYETMLRRDKHKGHIELERADNAIIRADENALLSAAWKSLRFLEIAIADGIAPSTLAERFLPLRRHLKDVRDMREHEEEYRLGGGQARNRHAYRDEESGAIITAGWTFIHRNRYLIGGRLSLTDLSLAVRYLFKDLKAGGYWVLPWGDLGVAESGPYLEHRMLI